MRSRRWLLAICCIVVIAVLGYIFITQSAPKTSQIVMSKVDCVSDIGGNACIRFPTMTGDSLNGQFYTLPEDLEGEYVFLVVPFDRDQQSGAQTWLPFAQTVSAQYPSLSFYNVPVFPDLSAGIRLLARSGLIALMNAEEQAFTITVFLEDREAFLRAMSIPDVEQIQTFLLNAQGEVLWRSVGEYSDEKVLSLQILLQTLYEE